MSVILKYGIVWTVKEDKFRLDVDGSVLDWSEKLSSLDYLVSGLAT